MLTPKQAASRCGLTKCAIYQAIRSGVLPTVKGPPVSRWGKTHLIRESDLDQWRLWVDTDKRLPKSRRLREDLQPWFDHIPADPPTPISS